MRTREPLLLATMLLLSAWGVLLPATVGADEPDDEPPGEVPDLRLQTPFHSRGAYWNVNTTPTWTWGAAEDDHGIDRYEIAEYHFGTVTHEATRAPDDRSYLAQEPAEGLICIEVTAVDTADQEGPTTYPHCVWLDTLDPENAFTHPRPSTLYLATGDTLDVTPMPGVHSERAYALGELTGYLNSSDPGEAPSGVYDADIYERPASLLASGEVLRGCENRFHTPEVCRWTDTTDGVAHNWYRGVTEDNAGNRATVHRNYTMVDVAAVEAPHDGGTSAVIHWELYQGEDFDRYEVYAIQEEGLGLASPARLVASIEDPDKVSVVDEVPDVGETWSYQQVTYTTEAGVPQAGTPTHQTTLAFAGEDGRISDPRGCTPGGICPFVHT